MERLLEVLEPDNPSEAVGRQCATALLNLGTLFATQGRDEEARAPLQELLRRYGQLETEESVARAHVTLGLLDWRAKQFEEARARFEEVVRRFGGNFAWSMQSVVAESLVRLGALLHETGRTEEARVALEEVSRRYGKPTEFLPLKELVARALIHLGSLDQEQGHFEPSLARYAEVLRWLGEEPEVPLRGVVAEARNSSGFALLCEAKRCLQREAPEAARVMLERANAEIAAALRHSPEEAVFLGNAAYVAFLQGRKEEARKLMAETIRRGGEDLRHASLLDTEIHPLPVDEEWRKIIREVPAS